MMTYASPPELQEELFTFHGVNISISSDSPWILEAMHNTLKYSTAKNATLKSALTEGVVVVTFIDDGKGFDMDAVENGYGLKNMRSRAEKLGGKILIDTGTDSGTKVELRYAIAVAATPKHGR